MSRAVPPSERVEVRMVAQPASVPAARSFAGDALTGWGCEALLDDVGLCVSELATNATLHSGSSYFHVELEKCPGEIRVTVTDTGMEAVDLLARQPELTDALLDELTVDATSATGRGMFLVSALAAAWGIDELPRGKRVWAEFPVEPAASVGTALTGARVTRSAERSTVEPDPEDWAIVRFRDCPAALLVAHDQNIAEYTRELQLIGDRLAEPSFQKLATVLAGHVAQHAANWDPARIIAREAVRDGRETVDIDVLVTRQVRESIRFLRSMVGEAEELSRRGSLMTLVAPEAVQRLRDWLEGEFLAQVEDGAEPLPYSDWLAGARR